MIVSCPACSTRYEVPASVLPTGGRLVRCSACRAEWLAKPLPVAQDIPAEADRVTQSAAETALGRTPETSAARIETTASVGTTTDATPIQKPPAAPRPLPEAAPEDEAAESSTVGHGSSPELVASREAREDPPTREIRSPATTARTLAKSLEEDQPAQGGTGFLAGFATVTVLVLLGVALYLRHEELARAIPSLASPIDAYVTAVDEARAALARLLARL